MPVKPHYMVFISGVSKPMQIEKENSDSCGKRKAFVFRGQDLSCAHSTKIAEGTAHTEREMGKVIHVCCVGWSWSLGSKKRGGHADKRLTWNLRGRHDDATAMPTHDRALK